MPEAIELLIHFFVSAIKLLHPGGVKVVLAESMAMKQQLIVMNRSNKRSPVLKTPVRFIFGILAGFISKTRLSKIAVILKPTTIITFHKSLVNRKYSRLYSNKTKRFSGRKPQDQEMIDLVIEMKKRNPFIERVICSTSMISFRHITTMFEPILLWILKHQRQWLVMTSRTITLFQSITIDGKNRVTVYMNCP